mmetsp:Transcript_58844/g.155763  ORF Transcript_58844/g.155763 Transcript_58844/m.155763 type:complete len:213 (+) Transcript_58844:48-686(+)
MPALCLRRSGMRLEQFRESDGCIEAKLVGIQGHWEDGAAFMWSTEMKRLGLEPYLDDPEWNRLCDSQGNQLFGTRKSFVNGIWLKWKKPTHWVTEFADLEMQETERYDPQEDLSLYRTIHTRRCDRESRMAARNELIKLSLMERNNQFDSFYFSYPVVITVCMLLLFIGAAFVASEARIFKPNHPPAVVPTLRTKHWDRSGAHFRRFLLFQR